MYVCLVSKSFFKTTTNSLSVRAHMQITLILILIMVLYNGCVYTKKNIIDTSHDITKNVVNFINNICKHKTIIVHQLNFHYLMINQITGYFLFLIYFFFFYISSISSSVQ